jgi:hypothetical protein
MLRCDLALIVPADTLETGALPYSTVPYSTVDRPSRLPEEKRWPVVCHYQITPFYTVSGS